MKSGRRVNVFTESRWDPENLLSLREDFERIVKSNSEFADLTFEEFFSGIKNIEHVERLILQPHRINIRKAINLLQENFNNHLPDSSSELKIVPLNHDLLDLLDDKISIPNSSTVKITPLGSTLPFNKPNRDRIIPKKHSHRQFQKCRL